MTLVERYIVKQIATTTEEAVVILLEIWVKEVGAEQAARELDEYAAHLRKEKGNENQTALT